MAGCDDPLPIAIALKVSRCQSKISDYQRCKQLHRFASNDARFGIKSQIVNKHASEI